MVGLLKQEIKMTALRKNKQYEKDAILIFVESGVPKCGIIEEHWYEGDQEICLTVYEPNEQNMLKM
jgi:hypothetical protein